MAIKRDRDAPRGMGKERFNQLLQQRAPEKLQDGKQMLYEHALRCYCSLCGGLLNWECPSDISYTETECCGLLYRLKPWTVLVVIEDVSSRPILPKMPGSDYSDPSTDLSLQVVGVLHTEEIVTGRPLTANQKSLRPSKNVQRCSICDEAGHNRRTCPRSK